jgi:hypothetical protein
MLIGMAENGGSTSQASPDPEGGDSLGPAEDAALFLREVAREKHGLLAGCLAAAAATLLLGIGWMLVRDDIAANRSVGLIVFEHYRFPLLLAGIAGVAVYALSSRLLDGPQVRRHSYALFFPPGCSGWPRFLELQADLAKLGYRVSAQRADRLLPAPVPDDAAVDEGMLWIREAHSSAPRAGLVLQLHTAHGEGCIEIADSSRGLYSELAMFLIVSLGERVPDLTCKEATSSLSAESWEWLRPQLPDLPRALPPPRG